MLLPPRMADDERVMTRFPAYAIPSPSRVTMAAPRAGAACRVWIGVGCWSFTEDERRRGALGVEVAPSAPMRRECIEALGGPDAARRAVRQLRALDVPHRDEELHCILAEAPRVGYAECPLRP